MADERYDAERKAVLDMMETDGWRVMMRWTQEQLDAFREGMPLNISTVEQLYFARGVVATLTDLLHTQDKIAFRDAEPELEFGPNPQGDY